ncbi:hypothetical protein PC110_g4380 [Phytophthora cactorum]|uniref:Uncharacterized protein n=1 Tax=Phytophthora cactorum TaxID=29920 RepID=A0A329SUE7_9STRA|nr:hypothetical protein PC110_g4380 [Phytophthora cactorum]
MKVSTISSYSLAAAALVAIAAAYEATTPAPTITEPYYDEELGCWPISVEHDATYCIDGPICSGSGVAIYRQHTKKAREEEEEETMTMVDVVTP